MTKIKTAARINQIAEPLSVLTLVLAVPVAVAVVFCIGEIVIVMLVTVVGETEDTVGEEEVMEGVAVCSVAE